ncbi:MAG: hypothetical protein E3J78_05730, partial [Candidatus Cloacimonadota bacterium]
MKRNYVLFGCLFVLLVLSSSLWGYPTFFGTDGIYRTYSARATEMGYLTFGLHGDYSYADVAGSDSTRNFGNIHTFLGYAPITFFEFALAAQIQMRYFHRPHTEDTYDFAFKNLRPIAKLGIPVFSDTINQVGFTLGTAGFVNIPWEPIASTDSQMVEKGFIGTVPRSASFGALFLAD